MKKFEFCYLNFERRPTFAVVYDEDLVSACERLLFRVVDPNELEVTPKGNYLVRGWSENEMVSIKEISMEPSGTFSCGEVQPKPAAERPTIVLNLGELNLSGTM